ncbi:hypothetical protein ASE48_08455 [Mycobacterium sp. Root265]|uniref:phage terminase small subunit n=1 Tax=Mycobacterium sp. Root265 TaxID=1736504 RepID=UPI00070B2EC2|nr:hypothetical protein [Mycobacterium sp. Root265]KRD08585.1 hypothetical protein ASE48_08455 [Mycobacterium sp. Root265]
MPGPPPKRDDERARRNKPDQETATVTAIGAVRIPEMGDLSHNGETHELIAEMYQSIKDSAITQFYEPTDWQFARITLFALNEELIAARHNGKPIGAMKLTAIIQMLSALMLTEGDRRRARIEIERVPIANGAKVIGLTDVLKQRLAAGGHGG